MRRNEERHMAEHEQEPDIEIECIAPNGLGYGRGKISTESQLEKGIITHEAVRVSHEVIEKDPRVFVPVEANDDGCGDGRSTMRIFQLIKNGGETVKKWFKKSLYRVKVFGGGLVAGASAWRTLSRAPQNNETVLGDRKYIAKKLKERGLEFGAHSCCEVSGDNCDCGAIDHYEKTTENALYYREEMMGSLEVLYGEEFEDNQDAIGEVFAAYEEMSAYKRQYFADGSGKETMDLILKEGAVVKELDVEHLEDTIIINDIEGTTVDQQYFSEKVREKCPDLPVDVQVFVVDVSRGRQIANATAEIMYEQDSSQDIEWLKKVAYADFLIRTLSIAATLTKGDLPVFRRKYAKKSDYDLAA